MSRETDLERIKSVLNTSDGQLLMDELAKVADHPILIGDTTDQTLYRVGQRDMFKFLELLQRGDYGRMERDPA